MTLHDLEAAELRAERIAKREVLFRWLSVGIACVAMMLSGLGLILVSQKATGNADKIDRTDDRAQVADDKADSADTKAAEARVDLDDIIRVLKQKKIVKDGRNGLQGSTGPRGLRGLPGARGPRGLPGEDGDDAPAVTQAELLATLTVYCESHACRGPEGARGPQGLPGSPPPRAFRVIVPTREGTMMITCVDTNDDRIYECTNEPVPAQPPAA